MVAKSRAKIKIVESNALNLTPIKNQLNLIPIKPKTINQQKVFDEYDNDKNLLLHGSAGCGKTFLAMYLALDEILSENNYKSLMILRSLLSSHEIGYLPGSVEEKSAEFETPYLDICTKLFNSKESYKNLKNKNLLSFKSTSFLRGTTIDNSIIIVDEIQNMDFDELRTIITRIGENCKLIFIGDFKQSDFRGKDKIYRNDVIKFISILKSMEDFSCVEFTINDIVRSKLVKNFLIQEYIYENKYLDKSSDSSG